MMSSYTCINIYTRNTFIINMYKYAPMVYVILHRSSLLYILHKIIENIEYLNTIIITVIILCIISITIILVIKVNNFVFKCTYY